MRRYSGKIDGDKGNYDWKVSFDVTNGYVGINQFFDNGKTERLLLSKAQMKALIKFYEPKKKKSTKQAAQPLLSAK